jgi:tetratricopeptide (TPR) repeat protein
MISSTARDLPSHRAQVMDACLRRGMTPVMMEHLTAGDSTAAVKSLAMVKSSAIYIVILGCRYGSVPDTNNPEQISITEMEYNHAVECGVPRLVFLMDKSHPVLAEDMDEDASDPVEAARRKVKLGELRTRAGKERIAAFFKSPADLRALVFQALVEFYESDFRTFRYISDIPAPPEEYIAHPYTLLQTSTLIGRQAELKLLTDWVTGKTLEADGRSATADSVRIISIIAFGGMGKSALTWKWFKDIAPEEMKPLAGRLWWSFYDGQATFENFVTCALAYVSQRSVDEVQKIALSDRERQLLAALDHNPFLLVLDGLERILVAYVARDPACLDDSQLKQEKDRKTADPRVGRFLRKLTQVEQSRILVSSRLYPNELETEGGDPLPGSFRRDLRGLSDEDAVELWRAFGVGGSREEILPVFNTFGKHPLLIQILAGEVKRSKRARGNFVEWQKANPQFDPSKCRKLKAAIAHVLGFAQRGLNTTVLKVLRTIAAFRMPAKYDTLAAILAEPTTGLLVKSSKVCTSERELDAVLTELEDRGFVGWDRRANRYNLHPVVRGEVWSGLPEAERQQVYEALHDYLSSVPVTEKDQIRTFEDLSPTIELYHTLIGLKRYEEATDLFYKHLNEVTLFRFSASRMRAELLELLAPHAIPESSSLSPVNRAFALNALAATYLTGGEPAKAATLYRQHNSIYAELGDQDNLCIGLGNLSNALRQSGRLHGSEASARQALLLTREQKDEFLEAVNLGWLGISLAVRGEVSDGEKALQQALRIFHMRSKEESVGRHDASAEATANAFLARIKLWLCEPGAARPFADRGWQLASVEHFERYVTLAKRMLGAVALALDEQPGADELLNRALVDARATNLAVEEILALIELAELRLKQADVKAAEKQLENVWELAERGPYPLFHADAFNVLAQIELHKGNPTAAIESATKAYTKAWCDGPPFAYHWGLEKAKQQLNELGAPEPQMPPFDTSKFEPMPEVEIDPVNEFHVGDEPAQ